MSERSMRSQLFSENILNNDKHLLKYNHEKVNYILPEILTIKAVFLAYSYCLCVIVMFVLIANLEVCCPQGKFTGLITT